MTLVDLPVDPAVETVGLTLNKQYWFSTSQDCSDNRFRQVDVVRYRREIPGHRRRREVLNEDLFGALARGREIQVVRDVNERAIFPRRFNLLKEPREYRLVNMQLGLIDDNYASIPRKKSMSKQIHNASFAIAKISSWI